MFGTVGGSLLGMSHTTAPLSPAPHDFDFQVGSWEVHHRRLHHPLTGADPDDPASWYDHTGPATADLLLHGTVSIDQLELAGETGMSFRIRTPGTDEWTIYWVSTRDGVLQAPVVGVWQDGRYEGIGPDVYGGKPILARYVWSEITATTARWEQAFSVDDGATWESNWVMQWTRDGVGGAA